MKVPETNLHPRLLFQNVLENLPGVNPGSEAVRQAVGAMTGADKDKDKEKKSKDQDKDKK